MTIGSDPHNDICVHDTNVSGEHAELLAEHRCVCLIALGSNTGILVDGSPIARFSLRGGERVEVGSLKFSVALVSLR